MRRQEEGGEEATMPWSRAAMLALARETAAAAGAKKKKSSEAAATGSLLGGDNRAFEPPMLRNSMPPWPSSPSEDGDLSGDEGEEEEGEEEDEGGDNGDFRRRRRRRQCDRGGWPFALFPSRDGSPSLVLEVELGKDPGSSSTYRGGGGGVELDVRARYVGVRGASGSLLRARLPGRVDPGGRRRGGASPRGVW